jgi:hypothetical protein
MDPPGMTKIVNGDKAFELGKQYTDWDEEQLSQSAEFANNIAPEIRELAGYTDVGTGTFREVPLGKDDEIIELENTLWDVFWGGYYAKYTDER